MAKPLIKVFAPKWTKPVSIPLDVAMDEDGVIVMRPKQAKRVRVVFMYYDYVSDPDYRERVYGMKDYLKDGDNRIPVAFDPAIDWPYEMTPIDEIPDGAVEIGAYVIEFK